MNQQLINPKTGEFAISKDFVISDKTTIDELLAYFGENNLMVRDMKNGHANYSIHNFKIGELYFIFTFYFFNKKMTRVSFLLQEKSYFVSQDMPTSNTSSWDDFDEKEEIKKGEFLKLWLIDQMKGDYQKYQWGKAGVSYDHHNLYSSCVIQYDVNSEKKIDKK